MAGKTKPLTDAQKDHVREHYRHTDIGTIAIDLQVSRQAIYSFAMKEGLKQAPWKKNTNKPGYKAPWKEKGKPGMFDPNDIKNIIV